MEAIKSCHKQRFTNSYFATGFWIYSDKLKLEASHRIDRDKRHRKAASLLQLSDEAISEVTIYCHIQAEMKTCPKQLDLR